MPENNTLTPLIDSACCYPYEPKAALIVFATNRSNPETFLELRNIRKDGTMAGAKPVSKQFVQDMLAALSPEYRRLPHGLIPENLIYCDPRQGHERYIWYNPPCKRNRFFADELGLEDGQYHVPGTLYAVKDQLLSVFCFSGKKPSMDKPLLGVPYFNIYKDGSVCMGNAYPKIPDTDKLSYEEILLAWENAFWNSVDVHTNGSPSTKANLIETIKKYKNKPFDTKDLETRKDGLTVNGIISKMK